MQALMLLGESRRIKSKPFVRVFGKELFLYGHEILREVFNGVTVVASTKIRDRIRKYDVSVVYEDHDVGPLGGIYEGAKNIGGKYFFVAGCDMPFLKKEVIEFMKERVGGDGLIPLHPNGMLEGLHAFYRRKKTIEVLDKILPEKHRITELINEMKVGYIPVEEIREYDSRLLSFMNVNTSDDLKLMEKIMGK